MSLVVNRKTDLFVLKESISKQDNLMIVLDEINRKMGKQCIRIASQGHMQPWAMKQQLKSKSFTTKWDELMLVKTELNW